MSASHNSDVQDGRQEQHVLYKWISHSLSALKKKKNCASHNWHWAAMRRALPGASCPIRQHQEQQAGVR